jgi:hypothetical protein
MGICLKILTLSDFDRFNVGRVRLYVLRALLLAADLGKYYDRTLKYLLRPLTKYLLLDIRNDLLYKIM